MAEKSSENSVRSIQRALNVLMCFTWNERELTLTEITERVGLAKSTILRMLTSLELEGFISKDQKTNRYKLGHNIYYLGLIAKESLDIRKISRPIMEEIGKLSKETVNLYVLDQKERVCFEQVESPQAIKQSVRIGERFAIWAGATGKSILAHLEESMWYEMINDIEAHTENTIIDPDGFIGELKKIRKAGFAVSVGEKDHEVGCVAAPIFDAYQKTIGCLSISGPRFRFPENTDLYSKLVIKGAKKISSQLGYYEKSIEYMEYIG
ncbi:IclR family transcriptional regulator [Anaerosolibacter sp.]|uniref:IclR family transcriptional regulator n=1 Tax=Anaerosolibacter sp. TaxID=1872527 RepID=UPI0039EE76FA